MHCPRCETKLLDERERDGIVVDICSSCRGIWLDRGELEKLIARATRDFEEVSPRRDDDTPPYGVRPSRHHDHDDDHQRRHPKRKKQWFESLGDLFD